MLPLNRRIKIKPLAVITFSLVMIIVLALSLFFGCAAKPEGRDVIIYPQTWLYIGDDAPWFLGLDRGYFLDEGIEFSTAEGKGSGLNIKMLGAGEQTFGEAGYDAMMLGIQEGMPIKGVFGYYQKSPNAITSLASAPIRSVKELEGKSVAAKAGAPYDVMFPALCKVGGADINKINLVHVAPGVTLTMLAEEQVDAILGYFNYASLVLPKEFGLETHVVLYADMGINVLNHGIVVNNSIIESNPDLVKRFVRASQKSFADAVADPEAAIDSMIKYVPVGLDREKELASLRMMLTLLHTEATEGKAIGWVANEDWEASQDLLFEIGEIKQKLPIETYFTNEFLP